MKPLYLYIHIPYCHHRCPYCDFNTYVQTGIPQEEYAHALMTELDFYWNRPEWSNRPLRTIYFGGGTPSLFDVKIFKRLFYSLSTRFKVTDDFEITIEANPNDLNIDKLKELHDLEVNRLSIGAQSFNAITLKELGRTHSSDDIERGVSAARKVGFKNISTDLLFGAPKQSVTMFHSDIERLLQLEPEHASLYSLTVEKGTEFFTRQGRGSLKLPDSDAVAEMMDFAVKVLPQRGLLRYEVSNFSKPGFESKHNSAYWDGSDYLGLGAGAHSMFTQKDGTRVRWANVASPSTYMKQAVEAGTAQAWGEKVSGAMLGFEYLMLGLRRPKGISLSEFKAVSGQDLYKASPGMVEVLEGSGFLKVDGDALSLTEKGLAVADSVIENFLPEKK